ncbi:hypothetical protein L0Z42_20910 [Burkholderia multivorans]|nr:hypothetical protein [Burkholderia multivorans]MBU9586273.1 hypothetical protein [Burkholderia multivorans]MCO1372967.1 hypothetical protein [Burkholderia multivorans]MCO1455777.1 hypothetical protein [Burkholderia multivorans]MCO1470327.1 hypothetical protein [Burkholderia multivorans]UQO20043.1 hypothetical protein L0Z02_18265 [Burkholderia multivorans]
MRTNGRRHARAARGRLTRCGGASVWQAAFAALGAVLTIANAAAAPATTPGGIVRFTGALVDRYDVTLDRAPVATVDRQRTAATLRVDAQGRRLPGAQLTLIGADGAPLGEPARSRVQAVWREAGGSRAMPVERGMQRVGPHGGTLTIAVPDDAGSAPVPVIVRIAHP